MTSLMEEFEKHAKILDPAGGWNTEQDMLDSLQWLRFTIAALEMSLDEANAYLDWARDDAKRYKRALNLAAKAISKSRYEHTHSDNLGPTDDPDYIYDRILVQAKQELEKKP